MSFFKTKVKVITEPHYGYDVRIKESWVDEWVSMGLFSSLESAIERADEVYRQYNFKSEVVYEPN